MNFDEIGDSRQGLHETIFIEATFMAGELEPSRRQTHMKSSTCERKEIV